MLAAGNPYFPVKYAGLGPFCFCFNWLIGSENRDSPGISMVKLCQIHPFPADDRVPLGSPLVPVGPLGLASEAMKARKTGVLIIGPWDDVAC